MDLDIKIAGGLVVDGTGASPAPRDVGILGEEIEAVGELSARPAKIVLNAKGKYVCPGFIDAHSHSDSYLLIEPSAASKIYQGITTEVVGNCGASAAPLTGDYHMPSDWRDKPYPGTWHSVAEYRALLEEVRPAPNVVLLIGHNTLRVGVAGYENRKVTATELRQMVRLLEKSLEEGGRGLSTGLIYAPGLFAPREELVELAKAAARHDGIYTSHMRSEGARVLEAIQETVTIGREAGIRVEISHLKTSGRANWGLIDEVLEAVRKARKEGVEVAADRYPYTASSTDLDVVFPAWAQEGGREAIMKRLGNPAERARLKDDLRRARSEEAWSTVVIGSTRHPDNTRFRGMPLTEAAKALGMEPVEAVLHFVETDEVNTGAFFGGMSEENMMRILAEPYVMLGTDASLRALNGPLSTDYQHPRAYGSFPRFLRMALDDKTVALGEAVRKMTSLPADHFRLKGRGRLVRGTKADVVIVDPARLADKASYSAPHQLSEGIDYVMVNGVLTVSAGRLTGNRGGRLL
jgi:N-acyl-D-amino-acid deacylase